MANILKLKSRAADATAPTTGNLADREVAISIPGKTIYINDAGTVKAVANYFPDAASDGKQYARKDGAWAEVDMLPGGDRSVDGGAPDSVYLPTQVIDGGGP